MPLQGSSRSPFHPTSRQFPRSGATAHRGPRVAPQEPSRPSADDATEPSRPRAVESQTGRHHGSSRTAVRFARASAAAAARRNGPVAGSGAGSDVLAGPAWATRLRPSSRQLASLLLHKRVGSRLPPPRSADTAVVSLDCDASESRRRVSGALRTVEYSATPPPSDGGMLARLVPPRETGGLGKARVSR